MAKGRSRKRPSRQRHVAAPHAPLANTQHHKQQPDHRTHDLWLARLRPRIAALNKAVLAAVGTGLVAVVTAAVIALPHLVASKVLGSPPPLTVAGTSSGKDAGGAMDLSLCSLAGTYLIPGALHLPRTPSTEQLTALTNKALHVDADFTSGTYTLQANPGQTVVVTAIHTFVIKRVLAPRVTELEINSACAFVLPATVVYCLSINLDAKKLSPILQEAAPTLKDPGNMVRIPRLQAVVTNESPIILNFVGYTSKYDVIWKILIDYTVNGRPGIAWIENGSKPFHTIAGLSKGTPHYP